MTSRLPFVDALDEVCRRIGFIAPRDLLLELASERAAAKDRVFDGVDPGVHDLLVDLRRRNVLVGVLSNCAVEEVRAWEGSPLAALVDATVWSCDEGVAKPSPEAYDLICRRLGVTSNDALFVGDGSFDELAGARRAGLQPVWASWFVGSWPANLSTARREEVFMVGVPEATQPSDVIAHASASAAREGR